MFSSKKSKVNNIFLLTALILSLSFGFSFSEENDYLIPMGNVIQIDAELNHVMVRNKVKSSQFELGDEFLSIDNNKINTYGDFSKSFSKLSDDEKVDVKILRGNKNLTLKVTKEELENLNLNDALSGFATLTYIDPTSNEFAAVGHPIGIGSQRILDIKEGYIFNTHDTQIQKSSKGNVGCLSAKRNSAIGKFTENNLFGIKGTVASLDTSSLEKYKIASLDEVKIGYAQLVLQDKDFKTQKFDIEIISIDKQDSPEPKTFRIKITDERLLDLTGGIVQGMSGTPIVQDDKIIGAVSHAIENNPANGYGVFIKWMME